MKHCLIVILILFTVALSAAESAPFSQPEIRAVWAMPWDIDSPQAIDNLIQTAVDNNQTELLLEVRYRADALYDTSRGEGDYPNPEPRYRMLKDANFDPLGYALEKAHAAKLQVQAWVIVFNATPTSSSLIQQNYIYQNHRDWITYDRLGRRMTSSSQFGYFIDPGIPEVQDYLLNVFGNLCTGYPELDGIHLDYIRYPEPDMGYHPISVERYKEYCRNHADITYNEWRIMQVSGFVGRLYRQTKQINPRMIVSAAVFADIADANVAYAQEWQSWLKNGIIDLFPYTKKLNSISISKPIRYEEITLFGFKHIGQ